MHVTQANSSASWAACNAGNVCTPFTLVTAKKKLMRARFQAVSAGWDTVTPMLGKFTHSLPQSNASTITIWQKNTVILEKSCLNIARHSPSLPIFNTNDLTYGSQKKKRRTKDTLDELTDENLLFARSFLSLQRIVRAQNHRCKTCIMHFSWWRNFPLL